MTRKIISLIPQGEASPSGFRNVYEDGDEWEKVRGCEGCPGFCCGTCRSLMKDGRCLVHVHDPGEKKLYCVEKPTPNTCIPNCLLVFKCVKGTNTGKFRHLTDRDKPFREER